MIFVCGRTSWPLSLRIVRGAGIVSAREERCARECPFAATAVVTQLASGGTDTDERGKGDHHRVAPWSSRDLGDVVGGQGRHDRLLGSGWHYHHESGSRQSTNAGNGRRRGAHTTEDIPRLPACRRASAHSTPWRPSASCHSTAEIIGASRPSDQASRRRQRR